ncbi:hypothetical protein EJB05_03214, partial [Eragrostis curvula]
PSYGNALPADGASRLGRAGICAAVASRQGKARQA